MDTQQQADTATARTALWAVARGQARVAAYVVLVCLGAASLGWAVGSSYWVIPIALVVLVVATIGFVGGLVAISSLALRGLSDTTVQRVFPNDPNTTAPAGGLALCSTIVFVVGGLSFLSTPHDATMTVQVGQTTAALSMRGVLLATMAGAILGILGMGNHLVSQKRGQ